MGDMGGGYGWGLLKGGGAAEEGESEGGKRPDSPIHIIFPPPPLLPTSSSNIGPTRAQDFHTTIPAFPAGLARKPKVGSPKVVSRGRGHGSMPWNL